MANAEHTPRPRKIVRWEGFSASPDEYPAFMARIATQIELRVEDALQNQSGALNMKFYREMVDVLPELSHSLLRYAAQSESATGEVGHQREMILWYYASRIAVTVIKKLQRECGAYALDWDDFLQDVQEAVVINLKKLSPAFTDRELELFRIHIYSLMVERGRSSIRHGLQTQPLDRPNPRLNIHPSAEESYEHIEFVRAVRQAIAHGLSNYQQEVLHRYYAFGQTQEEIAAIMGFASTDRVKSLLFQGLGRIRRYINKYYSRALEGHERWRRIIRDEYAITEAIAHCTRSALGLYDEVASPFPSDTTGLLT